MVFGDKDKSPGFSTIIGKACQITGHINSPDSIRIDGTVKGNVLSDKQVHISEGAQIDGNITAVHILNAGKVTGNITASELFELEKSGVVSGDIRTQSLKISLGAKMNGSMSMNYKNEEIAPIIEKELTE